MATLTIPHVVLTVRGSVIPTTPDELCQLHNMTAGSDEGVAAARALGDLSHKAYLPVPGVPGADEKELLFIDVWRNPEGLATFFSDAQVQQGAGMMFSDRDASVWVPARGAFGFELEAPARLTGRYVGVVRGPISDPAEAIDTFAEVMSRNLADARRRGQLSHQLYIGLTGPGEPVEALGIDVWADPAGMAEHYAQLSGFEKAFSGAPATSVWQAATTGGQWTEW